MEESAAAGWHAGGRIIVSLHSVFPQTQHKWLVIHARKIGGELENIP